MLSTKFKVSFVKLSLEIRRGLKDILHTVVTSNLIIISREKSLVLKDKDGKRVRGCVGVCFVGVGLSFLEMHFCIFFCSCSLHISTDIKRHQIAQNSPRLCIAAKRVAGILPRQKVRVEIRDKMPFEVDYSWEGSRSSFTHITRCSSPPSLLQTTLRRGGWAVLSVTPASKSYTDLHFYANSGCHGVFAKKPREAKIYFSPEVWLKCSPLPEL